MTIETFFAFNLVLLAAIASPGPAFLVAVRTTLSAGRSSGVAIGLGLGTMAATWTLAALLGLEGIFHVFPWAYMVVKTAGAAYLIYIAVQMWAGARTPIAGSVKPRTRSFLQGLTINLLNPKSVLFAAAVLVVVFPPDMSAAAKGLVVMNHLLVEFAFYTILALCMSTPSVSRAYLKTKVVIDRFAAVVLGALGLRLLFDRSRGLAEDM